MLKSLRIYILLVLLFSLLGAVVFRCAWGPDTVFSGSDTNIGLLKAYHRALPERFTGAYSGTSVFGGTSKIPMSVANIGTALLSPELFTNVWYAFYLVLSSICLIAFLRLWNLRWTSCVLGALSAFWVGSITISSSGHLYKLGVMALFTSALFLIEKSVRAKGIKRLGLASLAGFSVGLMLLEQQDVGLLAGIFLGVYTLFRLFQTAWKQWVMWASVLAPVAIIALAMSALTALSSYQANVVETGIRNNPEQRWEYITQWSMVPSELPDLIAPGYTGWSTGNPDGPYWGKCGQSAEWKTTGKGFRNFRLDSIYIGALPILLALFGCWTATRNRKDQEGGGAVFLLWSILGLAAISLSFGKFSPVYKLFYNLPLVGNIRAPIKFLHNFQVIIGILVAYGVNHLIALGEKDPKNVLKKVLWIGSALAAIFIVLALNTQTDAYGSKFSEWGQYAPVITRNIGRAWGHAGLMAGLFCIIIFLIRKKYHLSEKLIIAVLVGSIVFDSVYITSRYFKALDTSTLKNGNVVINHLKDHQGDERVFFLDQGGVYNSWLALDVPYHGLQVFNVWQMPRMPADYKEFLGTVGRNQIRLWQLASVKYITAPAGILVQLDKTPQLRQMFEPEMYYRFVQANEQLDVILLSRPDADQDQVLLRFDAHIPRFSLFLNWNQIPADQQCKRLSDPAFNPLTTVVLEEDPGIQLQASGENVPFRTVESSITRKNAVLSTNSDKAGILLFTQRYQPERWLVMIDGEPAKLLRCNFLCMGVAVPAGHHEVEFALKR